MNENIPLPLGIYEHFKGKFYGVLEFSIDAETSERVVHYTPLYTDSMELMTRTVSNFLEEVDWPDGTRRQRFMLKQKRHKGTNHIRLEMDTEWTDMMGWVARRPPISQR